MLSEASAGLALSKDSVKSEASIVRAVPECVFRNAVPTFVLICGTNEQLVTFSIRERKFGKNRR